MPWLYTGCLRKCSPTWPGLHGTFPRARPAVVLFERICRENGITQRLTRPASPTTTGKIERQYQSLQDELADDHGPFESLEALQAALDAWRNEYNTDRPHQSLNMAFPVSRFAPATSSLELRLPAQYEPPAGDLRIPGWHQRQSFRGWRWRPTG